MAKADERGFMECPTCAAKPGTPVLCESCLNNRSVIWSLEKNDPPVPYQWKWQKVDKPGVWAYGGDDRSKPPKAYDFISWDNGLCSTEAWRAYLGIPDIAPPEPELRLPKGWTHRWDNSGLTPIGLVEISLYDAAGVHRIGIRDPDKPTAIRAAQAAVDELEKGT